MNEEGSSAANLGLKPDPALMLVDNDRVGDRQALSCSLTQGFGCEKGFKDSGSEMLGYSGSGVLDGDLRAVALAAGTDGNGSLVAQAFGDGCGNSVGRVNDQVEDNLVELADQAGHQRKVLVKIGNHHGDIFPFM